MSDSHSRSPETLEALVTVLGGLTLVDEEAKVTHVVAPEIRLAQDAVEHAIQALTLALRESASLGGASDETLRGAVGALADASRLVARARRTIVAATQPTV
jgi:hypothetical protein